MKYRPYKKVIENQYRFIPYTQMQINQNLINSFRAYPFSIWKKETAEILLIKHVVELFIEDMLRKTRISTLKL